jgi:hypothetical protein
MHRLFTHGLHRDGLGHTSRSDLTGSESSIRGLLRGRRRARQSRVLVLIIWILYPGLLRLLRYVLSLKIRFDPIGHRGEPESPPGRRCVPGNPARYHDPVASGTQRILRVGSQAEYRLSRYWSVAGACLEGGQRARASQETATSAHRAVSWMCERERSDRRSCLRPLFQNIVPEARRR